jgi:hypothetical protein
VQKESLFAANAAILFSLCKLVLSKTSIAIASLPEKCCLIALQMACALGNAQELLALRCQPAGKMEVGSHCHS